MKFSQLSPGTRFEYEGRVYVKTGPVAAAPEDGGGQRMIPRWAVLKPVGGTGPAPAAPRALDADAVRTALADYHTECACLLEQADADPTRRAAARAELEAARCRFLAALGLPD